MQLPKGHTSQSTKSLSKQNFRSGRSVTICLIAFDLEFTEIWHQTESSLSNQEGKKKKKKSVQLKIYDLPFNETEQMKFKYTSVKRLERIFFRLQELKLITFI